MKSFFKKFPQITYAELNNVLRIPMEHRSSSEKNYSPLFAALSTLLNVGGAVDYYALLLRIPLPGADSGYTTIHQTAISAWADYISAHLAMEASPLAMLTHCDAELHHPIAFSALLLSLLTTQSIEAIIASGLLHRFAQQNYDNLAMVQTTFILLQSYIDYDPNNPHEKARDLLQRIGQLSIESNHQSHHSIFQNTRLNGMQIDSNSPPVIGYVINEPYFTCTLTKENWHNLHQLFNFSWVNVTLNFATTQFACLDLLKSIFSEYSEQELITLFVQINAQTAELTRSASIDVLSRCIPYDLVLPLIALKNDLSWPLLKNNPDILLQLDENMQLKSIVQCTNISSLSVESIVSLCRLPAFSPYHKEVYIRLFALLLTNPELCKKDRRLLGDLRGCPEVQMLCLQEAEALCFQLKELACESIPNSVLNTRDLYYKNTQKIILLHSLSDKKLKLPRTNHELHALMIEAQLEKKHGIHYHSLSALLPSIETSDATTISNAALRMVLECLVWTTNSKLHLQLNNLLQNRFNVAFKFDTAVGHFSVLEHAIINNNSLLLDELLGVVDTSLSAETSRVQNYDDILSFLAKRLTNHDSVSSALFANAECFLLFCERLPVEYQSKALMLQDKHQSTIFHEIAEHHPQILERCLQLLPSQERITAALSRDDEGNTVLHCAVKHVASLKILLSLWPVNEQSKLVGTTSNRHNETILHLAAEYHDSLLMLLKLWSKNDRGTIVKDIGQYGPSIVHNALPCLKSLAMLLELVPSDSEHMPLMMLTDMQHLIALHDASLYYPQALLLLLPWIPAAKRLDVLQLRNQQGESLLHKALTNPESLHILLTLWPEISLMDVLELRDNNDESVLQNALDYPESLAIILSYLSPKQQIDVITRLDGYGVNILYHALKHPDSLMILWAHIPEDIRMHELELLDQESMTLIDHALQYPRSLTILCQPLTTEQYLSLLTLPKNGYKGLLHVSTQYARILTILLQYIPESKRMEMCRVQDKNCNSVMYYALKKSESCIALFRLLPIEQRWQALVFIVTEFDERVRMLSHEGLFDEIRQLLPEEHRSLTWHDILNNIEINTPLSIGLFGMNLARKRKEEADDLTTNKRTSPSLSD